MKKKKVTHVEILKMYPTPRGVLPRPMRKVEGGEIHEVDVEITIEVTPKELADIIDTELNDRRP